MIDFGSPDYDAAAVIEGHIEDVRRDIDAEFGPTWSAEKEKTYFVQAYRRMEDIVNWTRHQARALERDGQRPLSLKDRRTNEIRQDNARRLRLAALDRKTSLRYSPPPEGGVCAVLPAPRLRVVR